MPETHVDDLELLAYVEDDLDAGRRRQVAEHLDACPSCAEHVERLEVARSALRAGPLLELPEARREALLASLPDRRDPWRPLAPLRRKLAVVAPLAAGIALLGSVVAVTTLARPGDDEAAESRMAGAGEEDAGEAMPEAAQAFAGELVRTVEGPPGAVVRRLRREGIPAVVADGAVVARADADEVRAALAGRPAGEVGVYVR